MERVHAQDEERKQRLLTLETQQAELTHTVADAHQDVTRQQDLDDLHTTVADQQLTLQEHTDQLQLLTTTLAVHQHELQHTVGLALEEVGAKTSEVQTFLRHKNIATTSRYLKRARRAKNTYGRDLEQVFGIRRAQQDDEEKYRNQ